MTQAASVLKHLKTHKSITPLEALKRYGCMCLAERVRDLRERGVKITTTMVKSNGKHFARYVMGKS